MLMNTLIKAGQILGRGLEQAACRIELKRVGGDGMFWQRQGGPLNTGLWCPKQDWKKLVLAMTDIPDPVNLSSELLPCVSAAMLEGEASWLLDAVEPMPSACGLLPEIYPVLTLTHAEVGDITCVLINWPQDQWQSIVTDWSPFAGSSANLSLSLVAGFALQTSSSPQLPAVGGGVWLDGDIRLERGEALLWCNGPLARVTLAQGEQGGKFSLMIDEIMVDMDLLHTPVIAEIARVTLPISHLGAMMMGDKLQAEVSLNAEVRLCYQDEEENILLGTASLLRSGDDLLAQVEILA
ncbi:hypothetical protein FS373_15545 [Shewanella sp. YLB-07]|nr:hypothetical protein [Shewanella sp. YLB-07]